MQEYAVASLLATSWGENMTSTEELVRAGYLPSTFAPAADPSRISMVDGHIVDSVRGQRGLFLPIPDIALHTVTPSESSAYSEFAAQYQRQWGRVDPLTVTIDSAQQIDSSTQQVRVRIWITPYARQRYAFFTDHLAPASTEHVGAVKGDVLRVDAGLRDTSGGSYQVHMALQDRNVTYRIVQGRLVRTDTPENTPFSKTSQYVAVTPGGLDGLQLVRQFVADLQHGPRSADTPPPSVSANPVLGLLSYLFGVDSRKHLAAFFAGEVVTHTADWSVYAHDPQIRQQVLPDLRTVSAPQPAQVRLTLADANQAEVGNYLHASAYLAARTASGLTAQTLNDLAGHFGMPPQQAPLLMQRIFEATPACPLQGTFTWRPATSGGCWASSAWHEPSIFELKEVPAGYRFPFLDWLRGATVEFSLTDATLAADVTLTVRNEPAGRSVPVSVENDVADDGAQPQADMGTTAGDEVVHSSRRSVGRECRSCGDADWHSHRHGVAASYVARGNRGARRLGWRVGIPRWAGGAGLDPPTRCPAAAIRRPSWVRQVR